LNEKQRNFFEIAFKAQYHLPQQRKKIKELHLAIFHTQKGKKKNK